MTVDIKIPCIHCHRLQSEHFNQIGTEWHWQACRAKGHPIEEPERCAGYFPMPNLEYLETLCL